MSDYDSSFDEEKRVKPVKKELKKEKKEKKEKKQKKKSEDHVSDDDAPEEPSSSKKRKRDPIPDEIEIDVNAPEPASKKAARKAKKAKTQPATAAADGTSETTTGADQANGTAAGKEVEGKRSDFSVWIGNLPWSATRDLLLDFLTTNAEIKPDQITRIHMPAPKAPPRPNWTSDKPQNKGFAYVDFSSELAMYSAIALTETRMDNRPLLIKNSKNFEGRPDKPKDESGTTTYAPGAAGAKGGPRGGEAKAPSKKIFVGNLAFETSKEDLQEHFGQCGTVEHIHMATFEDSGKSKGFAWVTFSDIDAATSATRGFVFKTDDAGKKRKWKLNKLMGRDLRCEFAEDGTTRYQKRYGKEKKQEANFGEATVFDEGDEHIHPSRRQRSSGGFNAEGRGRDFKPRGKVDPRDIRPGAAHANAPRASAAIVQAKGSKKTFD